MCARKTCPLNPFTPHSSYRDERDPTIVPYARALSISLPLSLSRTHAHTHNYKRARAVAGPSKEHGGVIGCFSSCARLDSVAAAGRAECCAGAVSGFCTLKGATHSQSTGKPKIAVNIYIYIYKIKHSLINVTNMHDHFVHESKLASKQ